MNLAIIAISALSLGILAGWVAHVIILDESGRIPSQEERHKRIQDELAAAAIAHCQQPTTETLSRLKRAVGEL